MNKEGKESICSCSSSNTRPATSTNSDQSVSCSSNRKHIKRRRIHMSKPKVSFTQRMAEEGIFLDDSNGSRRRRRIYELQTQWACNRDAIINLLEKVCSGEILLGNVNTDHFWLEFTKTLVRELNLGLKIDDETIESCTLYTQSLEKMHKEFQANDKAHHKIRVKQLSLGSEDLKKKLFGIFGRKISFKKSASSGSSSRKTTTSGRSYGANRKSNSSVNKDPNLRDRVADVEVIKALTEFYNDGHLTLSEQQDAAHCLSNNFVERSIWLTHNAENKIKWIKNLRARSPPRYLK